MRRAAAGASSRRRPAGSCASSHGEPRIRLCLRRYTSGAPSSSAPAASADRHPHPHCRHSLSDGTLRRKLRSGLPTLGVVTGFHNDSDHVETLGLLGYDFLWADAEHSSATSSTVANLILAAERRGMPTLVRIGYGYQNIIGHSQKFLVAGAQGIILPQCESAADAIKVVEAVKFPPLGKRGLAGERWNAWGLGGGPDTTLADRVHTSNANSVVGVVVESRRGIDALGDILSVKDIDFVFVAPTDLSADMGLHGQIRHPDVVGMVDEAGQRIRAAGVSSGMLALTEDDYAVYRKMGFQIMVGVAHTMFTAGAQSLMRTAVKHELSCVDRLKKAALLIIASNLSDEEVRGIREVFESIDLDDDGTLSIEELDVALGNSGGKYSKDILARISSVRDELFHSGQPSLDWREFLVRASDDGLILNERSIRRGFAELKSARGKSDSVTMSDLMGIFEAEEIGREIMGDVDTDGDR